jgi:hypothetical protein
MRRSIILIAGSILFAASGLLTWQKPPPKATKSLTAAPLQSNPQRVTTAMITAVQVREDVAALRQDFLAPSRSFSPAARAEAESLLAKLERENAPLGLASFGIELCRIAALADDGHTACDLRNLTEKFDSVPLRLASFGDELYVVGASAGNEDLLGTRVSGIDGRPIGVARDGAESLRGGSIAHRRQAIFSVVLTPEVAYALGVSRSPAAATYRFEARDGRAIERTLAAAPSPPSSDWRWLVPEDRLPWAWQKLDEFFRLRDAPELDAVVVQLRSNNDMPGHSLADFLRGVEGTLKKHKRRNIVLDLRFDDGGDLLKTRDFALSLPARVGRGGHVFALLGPRTFSAGIATAAYLKQAGGKRVVLVGEPPGDRLTFFAEGRSVVLPQSRLAISPATARHDYHDGCRAFDDCFAAVAQPGKPTGSPLNIESTVVRRPIAIATLEPDLAAPWSLDAFVAGRDPALEAMAPMVVPPKRAARH